MPGTIQVSVVDFMGLHSSVPQSQMCIKVSLGKRECISWDKEDLFFPVTTMRNDLVVTLQDAEGNEISHTGVSTKSVIEKGLWDDIFPLEGGGYVHMKLLFVLNDEDRNRIRKMREAALKNKLDKLLSGSEKEHENALVVAQLHLETFLSVLSPPCYQDSRTGPPVEVAKIKEVTTQDDSAAKSLNLKNGKLDSKSMDGFYSDQRETTPNDTDRSEETPLSSAPGDGGLTEVVNKDLFEKAKIMLTTGNVPVRDISSEEALSSLESSESDVAASNATAPPKSGAGEACGSDKPNQLEESQAGNREFEEKTEVLFTDKATLKRIGSTIAASNKYVPPNSEKVLERIGSTIAASNKSVPPKSEDVTHDREKQTSVRRTPSNVRKMISAFEGGQAQDMRPSVRSPPKKSPSSRIGVEAPFAGLQSDDFKTGKSKSGQPISGRIMTPFLAVNSQQTPVNITPREQTGSSKDTDELNKPGAEIQSTGANPSLKNKFEVSDKEEKKSPETLTIMPKMEEPTVSGGERRDENDFKNSSVQISGDELQSVSNDEGYQYCLETSGAWVFPDEDNKLCITTGDKRVTDLMGGWQTEANTYHASEKVEEDSMQSGSGARVNEGEKASHEPSKSKPEGFVDDDTSNGFLEQAIKVAIMSAFGILILLTRQRITR